MHPTLRMADDLAEVLEVTFGLHAGHVDEADEEECCEQVKHPVLAASATSGEFKRRQQADPDFF